MPDIIVENRCEDLRIVILNDFQELRSRQQAEIRLFHPWNLGNYGALCKNNLRRDCVLGFPVKALQPVCVYALEAYLAKEP